MNARASMSVLLATALLGCGCRTTSTRDVSSAPAPAVRVGTHARTWEVQCGGEVLGLVVLFADRRRAQDSIYVVRNAWHQDLGLIDALGRAFRYLPHNEEPVWVGSGTIAAGAQHILGTPSACELIERDEPEVDPIPGTLPGAGGRGPEHDACAPNDPSDEPSSEPGLPQSW